MEISKNLKKAVLILKKGGVIVYPTDTAYGLGTNCINARALKKVYQIKGRNFNKPLTLIAADLNQVKKIAKVTPTELKLIKKYWPGPLTILFKLRTKNKGLRTISKNGLIGIRIPKNKTARQLAEKLGRPLTATSANLSGQRECYSVAQVVRQLARQKIKPDLILNGGKLPQAKVSTIVRMINNKPQIFREGGIKIDV
jgi:L-threonylcarbamoyladenylate synthase